MSFGVGLGLVGDLSEALTVKSERLVAGHCFFCLPGYPGFAFLVIFHFFGLIKMFFVLF